jgi:diguanylate cyclase (GGDEF)-like protein
MQSNLAEQTLLLCRELDIAPSNPHLTQIIENIALLGEQASLAYLAYVDELTGARNLRGYNLEAPKLMELVRRLDGHLVYAAGDVDHFTGINNTYGHPVGDRILQILGQAANESLRSSDLFCRVGGDEFVLLLPTQRAEDTERQTLQRLMERYEVLLAEKGLPQSTLSFGCATYDGDAKRFPGYATVSPVDLVAHLRGIADQRLYIAKGNRNTIIDKVA